MTEDQKRELFEQLARGRKVRAAAATRRITPLKLAAAAEITTSLMKGVEVFAATDALIEALIVERRRASALGYGSELERALTLK